jgi:CBS domain-containing protein
MAKSVQDAMTPGVTSVEPSLPVVEAARRMRAEDVGSLPVVDESGQVIGMVTDRDIAMRLVAEGKDASATIVSEIASERLVTVAPDQDLDEALELMAAYQVRRLPVVDEGNRLVGILAQADVALEGKEKKVGEMVEEISQPSSTPRA